MRKKSSRKALKNKAWKAFARYIKAFYADKDGLCRCVTCGARYHYSDGRHINAGHFVPSRCNAVLFDEDIVRPQCSACNCAGAGEQFLFAQYLMREEGKTKAQIDEFLLRKHKVVIYKDFELASIAEEYENKADAIISRKRI